MDQKQPSIYVESPVKTVFKKFGNARDVSLVFGDPVEVGLKKVIPVAKLHYAGGGGGDGKGADGGGGRISVKPIGVFEVSPSETKFKPAKSPGRLAVLMLLAALASLLFMSRK